jgi:glucose-1-phosphate thymidylyltransferase
MRALILAAGYATRLYPLTKNWPKPLLLIKEQPLISHIMRRVVPLPGLREIIVITNDKFYPHFSGWARQVRCGKPLRVLSDGTGSEETRLGAIGDIDYVMRQGFGDDDLLVIGGDNLFTFDLVPFVSFAQTKPHDCTVGLYDIKDPGLINQFGVVTLDSQGQVVRFQEKPRQSSSTLVSMCIYYFPGAALAQVPEYLSGNRSSDAPGHYVSWLVSQATVWGFAFAGEWYDIGDIITFYHASVNFKT